MNARQAKRLALWLNGHHVLSADHLGLPDEVMAALPPEDVERLQEQQQLIGLEMIARSAIDQDLTREQAVLAVRSAPLPRYRR